MHSAARARGSSAAAGTILERQPSTPRSRNRWQRWRCWCISIRRTCSRTTCLLAADFDQSLIKVLNPSDLPRNRRSDTPAAQVRSIGDEWVWGAVQRYSGSQAFWFRAKAISCSIRGTRISPGYVLEKRWPFALMRGWGSSCWLLAPGFWHLTSGFWLPGPFLPAR